jgi:membrane protein DedA with SNARE-associated domain
MSLNDQILAALVQYGMPVLFGVVLLAATGVPLPASLMLIAAGSFVEQGEFDYWLVVVITATAAVIGDNLGYVLGRWGGRRLVARVSRWMGGEAQLQKAEAIAARWGGPGIFLSRWLIAPAGPAINLSSGIAAYAWPSFFFYDVTGEIVWVFLYVAIGRLFSDQVVAMNALLGDVSWAILGLCVAVFVGWELFRHPDWWFWHRSRTTQQ